MRTLAVAPLALAALVAVVRPGPLHLVVDSVLGVAVGALVVLAYVAALRWLDEVDDDRRGRERGPEERRSNR